MTLLELQRRMCEDVRRPLTDDMWMQETTEDGKSVAAIAESYVKPDDRLSSFDRLEIYNRQYWFRVIDAVSEDFPALGALVGSKKFDAMVLDYLKENPSNSWTLRDVGKKLPAWLAEHKEFAGRRHKLALDVAALEWAYVEAFDGQKVEPLAAEDMLEINGETRLMLQPHLQLLALEYPVDELVLAVRRDTPETEIVSNASLQRKETARMKLPPMQREKVWLAVHRYDDVVYYRRLEREQYAMLRALREGATLSEALIAAFAKSRLDAEAQAAMIRETFAHAAELGWFTGDQKR